MKRYAGDPYWITTRYAGACAGCGERFHAGAEAFYYPSSRRLYVGPCAERAAADFTSAACDEAAYAGEGVPWAR